MVVNPVSYETMCDILKANPNIESLRPLIRKTKELGYDGFNKADVSMALGWIRQFRVTRQPIFFNQTDQGLIKTYQQSFY